MFAADLQEEMAEQRFSVPLAPTKTAAQRHRSERSVQSNRAQSLSERSQPSGAERAIEHRTGTVTNRIHPFLRPGTGSHAASYRIDGIVAPSQPVPELVGVRRTEKGCQRR